MCRKCYLLNLKKFYIFTSMSNFIIINIDKLIMDPESK